MPKAGGENHCPKMLNETRELAAADEAHTPGAGKWSRQPKAMWQTCSADHSGNPKQMNKRRYTVDWPILMAPPTETPGHCLGRQPGKQETQPRVAIRHQILSASRLQRAPIAWQEATIKASHGRHELLLPVEIVTRWGAGEQKLSHVHAEAEPVWKNTDALGNIE